jgi:hypothetical protein
MPIPNPEHLLDQAQSLIDQRRSGPSRQVDLRRAISSAYYGVFHAVLITVAYMVVGRSRRASPQYALAYRGIDHKDIRELCMISCRSTPPARYAAFVPPDGFGADIQDFAEDLTDLQQQRHAADYDPRLRVDLSDAVVALATARRAMRCWEAAPADERSAFLTLLLFPPR